jgi:hypothetical protein
MVINFAALRVTPPDLIAAADLSPILRNDKSPEDTPPPDNGSLAPLIFEKFAPAPAPYLKRFASFTTVSYMPSLSRRLSFTWSIKQAEVWGLS